MAPRTWWNKPDVLWKEGLFLHDIILCIFMLTSTAFPASVWELISDCFNSSSLPPPFHQSTENRSQLQRRWSQWRERTLDLWKHKNQNKTGLDQFFSPLPLNAASWAATRFNVLQKYDISISITTQHATNTRAHEADSTACSFLLLFVDFQPCSLPSHCSVWQQKCSNQGF